MDPLLKSGAIPSIPYAALRTKSLGQSTHDLPTLGSLAAALEPLSPPPGKPVLQRIPATRLAKEIAPPRTGDIHVAPTAPAMGTLGHAVLEQLALNGWEGSVGHWLEILHRDFGLEKTEADTLRRRIEQTQILMREQTADMPELRPELPFVLHDGDQLIDGTIDLLCRTAGGFAIFDYKFTEAADAAVAETYRRQMEIYCKAARKIFPQAGTPEIALVIISSEGARVLDLCSKF